MALGQLESGQVRIVREAKLGARTAGALLTKAFAEVLGELPPADLYSVVVVRGPGRFRGMRVGLSAVKALSEAAGLPVVALSRLAILGELARTEYAALDAGRGSVYLRAAASGEERLLRADEACVLMGAGKAAVCEERVAALLPGARWLPAPTAADALRFAGGRVLAGAWDDVALLDALYLWRAEQMPRISA